METKKYSFNGVYGTYALRIVAIYVLFGSAWILLSDSALGWLVHDPAMLTRISTYKGLLFITLTALLLYSLIKHYVSQINFQTSQLKKLSGFQQALLDNAAYAIISTTPDGIITSFNRAAEIMLGYDADELIGKQTPLLFHLPEEVSARSNELSRRFNEPVEGFEVFVILSRRDEPNERDWIYVRKDGTTLAVRLGVTAMRDEAGQITGYLGLAGDISEHRQLEEQMRQQQKMEGIGLLAGGIAHDFNNILAPIFVYAEMIRKPFSEDDPIHKRASAILESAIKAKNLVRQLLSFSRKQVLAMQQLDLNEVVSSFSDILRRTIREDISIRTSFNAVNCPILADRTQVEQILLNLAVNAQDAIDGNGSILIETGNVMLDVEYCEQHPGTVPGQYVVLSVADSGCGISNEVLPHIFEPFFSTKAVGRGTGLGLSTVYGIVKQHEGAIDARSIPGHGTSFRIYLPLAAGDGVGPLMLQPSGSANGDRHATILLVEDNEMVMDMTRELLENRGYRVLTAYMPEDAIAIALLHAEKIDLLLSDVVMPQMNGPQLYGRISKHIPGLKVLYMSGYTSNEVLKSGAMNGDAGFISKPFSTAELYDRIDWMLAQAGQKQYPSGIKPQ